MTATMLGVSIRNLSWTYGTGVATLNQLSLELGPGSSLGLVGPSGCGKTTLARLVLALLPPPPGTVLVDDDDVGKLRGARLRRYRQRVQYIPQNPQAALNPRHRVARLLREPYLVHRLCPADEVDGRIEALLGQVGLGTQVMDRRPAHLSGGMQQRLVIARALSFDPELVVADEPTSSLDAVHAAQVAEVMAGVRRTRQLLLIGHHLGRIAGLVDRLAVMDEGRVVEEFPSVVLTELAAASAAEEMKHPTTRALLSAWLDRDGPARR